MTIKIFTTPLLRRFQQHTFSLLLLQQCTAFILFPSILAKATWLLLKIKCHHQILPWMQNCRKLQCFLQQQVCSHWKTARFSEFLNCYHMFSAFRLKQILETPKNQYLKSWHLEIMWNVEVTHKNKRQWK